jgi:hypothetical protein
MTHTIRFEHVEGRGPSKGLALAQVELIANMRLDERAILQRLRADGYLGVRLCSVATAATDANEAQRDLDRLLAKVQS